jgi:hypothetical protein
MRNPLLKACLIAMGLSATTFNTAQAATVAINNYITGGWLNSTVYYAGDIVTYNNKTYLAVNPAPGLNMNKPPESANFANWWQLLGSNVAGPAGAAGATGPQGPAGSAGAAGKSLLNGTAAPTTAVGAVGDFYMDTTNKRLYGPKTATGWPTAFVSVVGPAGANGATGPQGPAGSAGAAGKSLLNGTAAPTTAVGAVGDFYMDTTNKRLYGPKTATGWPTAFVSVVGPAGANGATGPQGPAGAAGSVGAAGKSLLNGTAAPTTAVGAVGDFYMDTTNKRLYGPKTATGWPTAFVSVVGPAGPAGANGATGPRGPAGPAGPNGATGPQGPAGPAGANGAAGPQGPAGATGATGSSGVSNVVTFNGYPKAPANDGRFYLMSPYATVLITSVTQKIVGSAKTSVISTKGIFTGDITSDLCYAPSSDTTAIKLFSPWSNGDTVYNLPKYATWPVFASSAVTDLAPGTYHVGLCLAVTAYSVDTIDLVRAIQGWAMVTE